MTFQYMQCAQCYCTLTTALITTSCETSSIEGLLTLNSSLGSFAAASDSLTTLSSVPAISSQ